MIDVENAVFDAVYSAVASLVPTGCFKSVYVPNPTQFPFATLMEIDNTTDSRMRDNSDAEQYAVVTYEANVYAMDRPGCRSVMNALDSAMIALGFTRIVMTSVPNLADSRIFRIHAKYRATAGSNSTIYRHS